MLEEKMIVCSFSASVNSQLTNVLVMPNLGQCLAVCSSHRVIGFAGLSLDVYQPDQPITIVINYIFR